MIRQYSLTLKPSEGRLTVSHAYRLYGWLMERVPEEFAVQMHEEGFTPISQHLAMQRESTNVRWTVSLLNDRTVDVLGEVLAKTESLIIDDRQVAVTGMSLSEVRSAADLIGSAESDARRAGLCFESPSSFKVNGQYALFPDVDHIVMSLVNQWNQIFPEISLKDQDALDALKRGLSITDYRLRLSRFYMKNSCISGFSGQTVLYSRLPTPLHEVWKSLLALASYCGIGIKTALGMGGVRVEMQERNPKTAR